MKECCDTERNTVFFSFQLKKKNTVDIIYERLSGIISFFHTKIKWTICDVCEEKQGAHGAVGAFKQTSLNKQLR